MKVLHIVPWYEPAWSTGGTAVATSMLCRSLVKLGMDVTVYTTNDKGAGEYLDLPLNEEIIQGGVKTWFFKCGLFYNFKFKAAAYSKSLIRKLRKTIKNYDLVHIGATRHWHGYEAFKLCKTLNKPYIITPHASLMEWWVKNIGNPIFKIPYMFFIDSKIIKGAHAIHYLCEGERLYSKKHDFRVQSFLIPNGIICKDFEQDKIVRKNLRTKFGLSDETTLLLHLGRIHPQKNIHLSIEALNGIGAYKNNVKYFIVGPVSDPEYNSYLQELVKRYHLESIIKFYPPVPSKEVKHWYSISDLMMMPSKVEGVSMSLIEALACSLPILVSRNVANYCEIEADKAGIVVNSDVESIKSGLISLLSAPETLKKMSINAHKTANSRYNIDKVALQMIKAYENILSGNRDSELSWNLPCT